MKPEVARFERFGGPAAAIVPAQSGLKVGGRGREKEHAMTALALYVRLEAKPGKEEEVAALLGDARSLVMEETGTTAWFAIRLGPSTFAIFDAFSDERGCEAHLHGKVAAALTTKAPDLFANHVEFVRVEVIADKLPH